MIKKYVKFWIFRKGSGTSFSTAFYVLFFEKGFLMIYYINWPSFIVWLPLLLEILGNMCSGIAFFSVCDVINFEINLSFIAKSFSYMTRKLEQRFKYLENTKSFLGEIKKALFKSFELPEIVSGLRVRH